MRPLKRGCVPDPRRLTADDPRLAKTDDGCWLWRGTLATNGYGFVSVGRRTRLAHRAFYEQANGPIPSGLVIDHICRHRDCVNPAHLRAVTTRENLLAEGSLAFVAKHAAKTHCPQCGGEYSREKAGRYCRPCRNKAINRWRRHRYATDPAYRANRLRRVASGRMGQ